MWVGDSDRSPCVERSGETAPHIWGPGAPAQGGVALFGPHGGASDGSLYVGTEAATMREG